ncbi:DUF1599 domain-containing protein [Niabella soli]|uniref:Nucleotide modification associated domain-containing protein n=1 Tax=Niabella soli DSM 19437 TaxID=929713 RepID=W0F016_9BACT|nr:DUF1599 domain-containing protein [Niabella soli]AHF14671.1 hypothetical protein NIASO_04665 [Niabella soli DSM 19437]
MNRTIQQYDAVIVTCKEVFLKKNKDYGTSWRVLRTISVVDQLYIKAQRIRTIQQLKQQKVEDDIAGEFKGIINYAVIGLIQLELPEDGADDLSEDEVTILYDTYAEKARSLMQDKNHDYGEAWRSMSQESFVDLILVKLRRIRQILSNDQQTLISEGIDANYNDILNYAVFALILQGEQSMAK